MLTCSLKFRLNRRNKKDPKRLVEPEAVTSAEDQGQLLRLSCQDLKGTKKYEPVGLRDLESLMMESESSSDEEIVQILGIKKKRKHAKLSRGLAANDGAVGGTDGNLIDPVPLKKVRFKEPSQHGERP